MLSEGINNNNSGRSAGPAERKTSARGKAIRMGPHPIKKKERPEDICNEEKKKRILKELSENEAPWRWTSPVKKGVRWLRTQFSRDEKDEIREPGLPRKVAPRPIPQERNAARDD